MCGDLNINYIIFNGNRKKVLDELFLSYNLNLGSCEHTIIFTNKHGATIVSKLDYIATNVIRDRFHVFVEEPFISDHKAVFLDYLLNTSVEFCTLSTWPPRRLHKEV